MMKFSRAGWRHLSKGSRTGRSISPCTLEHSAIVLRQHDEVDAGRGRTEDCRHGLVALHISLYTSFLSSPYSFPLPASISTSTMRSGSMSRQSAFQLDGE